MHVLCRPLSLFPFSEGLKAMKWVNSLLLVVVVYLSWSLATDRGLLSLYKLQQLIVKQQAENADIEERVAMLSREVEALKTSIDAVEEIAREEMGLIRPGEIFIRTLKKPLNNSVQDLPEGGKTKTKFPFPAQRQ